MCYNECGSDPITAISSPPDNDLTTSLTGDINLVREQAEQVVNFG